MQHCWKIYIFPNSYSSLLLLLLFFFRSICTFHCQISNNDTSAAAAILILLLLHLWRITITLLLCCCTRRHKHKCIIIIIITIIIFDVGFSCVSSSDKSSLSLFSSLLWNMFKVFTKCLTTPTNMLMNLKTKTRKRNTGHFTKIIPCYKSTNATNVIKSLQQDAWYTYIKMNMDIQFCLWYFTHNKTLLYWKSIEPPIVTNV